MYVLDAGFSRHANLNSCDATNSGHVSSWLLSLETRPWRGWRATNDGHPIFGETSLWEERENNFLPVLVFHCWERSEVAFGEQADAQLVQDFHPRLEIL